MTADRPAASAGFKAGMLILERTAGTHGDATKDSTSRICDTAGQERILSYRPTNGEQMLVQRIVPAAADLISNGCATRLAGRAMPVAAAE